MLNTLCGSVINLSGFKNIGGVVSVTCKVYITDFTILHFKILHIPSTDKNYAILFRSEERRVGKECRL